MKPYGSISKGDDFRRAAKQGRRVGTKDVVVFTYENGGPDVRVGMAVRATSAVERNRIKRRLRAALRAAQPPAGTDVVIRANRGAATTGFQNLVATLEQAVRAQ